jgi:exodeoxyribonuclease V alpha subunit
VPKHGPRWGREPPEISVSSGQPRTTTPQVNPSVGW